MKFRPSFILTTTLVLFCAGAHAQPPPPPKVSSPNGPPSHSVAPPPSNGDPPHNSSPPNNGNPSNQAPGGQLSGCATNCVTKALAIAGCASTDCLCSNQPSLSQLQTCVDACPPSDRQALDDLEAQQCGRTPSDPASSPSITPTRPFSSSSLPATSPSPSSVATTVLSTPAVQTSHTSNATTGVSSPGLDTNTTTLTISTHSIKPLTAQAVTTSDKDKTVSKSPPAASDSGSTLTMPPVVDSTSPPKPPPAPAAPSIVDGASNGASALGVPLFATMVGASVGIVVSAWFIV